jgi:hypothetical protein
MRFGLTEELPQHPRTWDMLRFALRKLGPWLIALVITVYLSYALPSSGQIAGDGAGLCAGGRHLFLGDLRDRLLLLDGPHRHRALYILRHQAFRPLWLIGSFRRLWRSAERPRLVAGRPAPGAHRRDRGQCLAALSTGLFILRFRRPIAHLIRNQPLSAPDPPRPQRHHRNPRHLLVRAGAGAGGISLFATFVSAGDTSTALRQSLICTVLLVLCMVINGLVRRHAPAATRAKRHALYSER